MPYAAPLQLTQRTQIDPRDTYDYTTPKLQVYTKPLDAYMQPAQDKLTTLAKTLSMVNPMLQQFTQLTDQINQDEYEKGQLARQKGEQPESKGWAYIKGYEELDGQIKAQEFEREVSDYHNQNAYWLSPEEYVSGLGEIQQKYLKGASDYFIGGFFNQAKTVEDNAISAYQTTQAKRLHDDTIDKIGINLTDEVDRRVNSILKESLGIASVTPDNLLDDPETLLKFNTPDNQSKLAYSIRAVVDTAVNQAKGLNIPPPEVSQIAVDAIGQLALKYAMPELMNFVDTKVNGVSYSVDVIDKAKTYQRQAQNFRDSELSARATEAKEAEKDRINTMINDYYTTLGHVSRILDDSQQKYEARGLLTKLENDPEMKAKSGSDYWQMIQHLNKVIVGDGKKSQSESNPTVLKDLKSKAYVSLNLTPQDVMKYWEDLKDTDRDELLRVADGLREDREREVEKIAKETLSNQKAAATKNQKLIDKAKAEARKKVDAQNREYEKNITKLTSNLIDKLEPKNTLSGDYDRDRRNDIEVEVMEQVASWRKEHGRPPKPLEFDKDIAQPMEKRWGRSTDVSRGKKRTPTDKPLWKKQEDPIKAALKNGYSEADIRKNLIGKGFTKAQADSMIDKARSSK